MGERSETATLAGGCFWCLEAVFEQLRGVERVKSGYSGGHVANPSYREVCTGRTGHAEAVEVEFDPEEVSYRELLEVFFAIHDPTQLNRQGPDVGTQYRSAIYYQTEDQKETADRLIAELSEEGLFDDPIVTEVSPLEAFYPAEDYHDEYYRRNAGQPYCQAVISPKLAKFRRKFSQRLKEPAPDAGD
jgi:peptide-methionine (S)-S-oxide reductase